jgi:hypothetical protein
MVYVVYKRNFFVALIRNLRHQSLITIYGVYFVDWAPLIRHVLMLRSYVLQQVFFFEDGIIFHLSLFSLKIFISKRSTKSIVRHLLIDSLLTKSSFIGFQDVRKQQMLSEVDSIFIVLTNMLLKNGRQNFCRPKIIDSLITKAFILSRYSNARKKWNEAGKDVVVLHMVNFQSI